MLGYGRPREVEEREARGEVERVYHEVRQSLRVTGVGLPLRAWAAQPRSLALIWDAVRPNVETRAFEDACDRVRAEVAVAAQRLGKLDVRPRVTLGESQHYQLEAALDLYHYATPKLMVLTSAVRLSLEGERLGAAPDGPADLVERGAPPRMAPMEMLAERPRDERIGRIFDDIRETVGQPSVHDEHRTLALWPDYLAIAWARLKPLQGETRWAAATEDLFEASRAAARSLRLEVPISKRRIADLGDDSDVIAASAATFERSLPAQAAAIALLELDFKSADAAGRSPFPAGRRRAPAARAGEDHREMARVPVAPAGERAR